MIKRTGLAAELQQQVNDALLLQNWVSNTYTKIIESAQYVAKHKQLYETTIIVTAFSSDRLKQYEADDAIIKLLKREGFDASIIDHQQNDELPFHARLQTCILAYWGNTPLKGKLNV